MSENERTLTFKALAEGLRLDGRVLKEPRNMSIKFNRVIDAFNDEIGNDSLKENAFSCNASCEVKFGDTLVVAFVTSEVVEPYPDHPNEGFFHVVTNLHPIASGSFELGSRSSASLKASSLIDLAVKDSGAVDLEALCISSGEKVWKVTCEITVLNHAGNIPDACSLAAIGALSHFRRPEVGFSEVEDSQDGVSIAKVEVISLEDQEPVPLSIIHWPVCITFGIIKLDPEFLEPKGAEDVDVPMEQTQERKVLVLLDTTNREEMLLNGLVSVIINEHGEICALEKQGWPPVDSELIDECCRRAELLAKQRLSLLLSQN